MVGGYVPLTRAGTTKSAHAQTRTFAVLVVLALAEQACSPSENSTPETTASTTTEPPSDDDATAADPGCNAKATRATTTDEAALTATLETMEAGGAQVPLRSSPAAVPMPRQALKPSNGGR